LPEGHPLIRLGRCQKARVESPTPLTVHLDGEFFCTAADRIHEIEVSLLPRVLPVYRPGG
jgi:diacylglycerol kinase family enzyme